MDDERDETEGGPMLSLYIGTGRGDEEGEDIEVETYGPGEEFTIYRGVRAWVDSGIEVVRDGADAPTEDEDDEGVLPRGRWRWTGKEIVWLGRQKGPARPPGR